MPNSMLIYEWHISVKIFKINLSSFALCKTSPFVILSVHFIFNFPLQLHVTNTFTTLSSSFPTVRVSDPQTATLRIQLYISLGYSNSLVALNYYT
jgi:hypothetical protein